VLSASARIDFEIARFFFDLGIPVYDCYGLTETSPAVTMNRPAACKLGTVGRPVGEVRVSIDRSVTDESSTEGENIVHGPNVMLGYHGKPDATAGVMTPDGGLRTGDRGYLDEEGYLHLTGRFKEQYKLANGKYVFPSSVEDQLLLVPYVASAMVYGEAQAYNVCLLALRLDLLDRVAKDAGVTLSGSELLRAGSALGRAGRELIRLDLLRQLQGRLAGYEIPRRFLFIAEPLTLENGMLTQTLKVRRQAVLERYKESLLALYRRDEDASAVED